MVRIADSAAIVERPAMMIGLNTYAATKAALEAHTLNLAAELAGTGVTANVYRPGAVDTAMQAWFRNQSPEQIGQQLHDRFIAMHASGTLLTPEQPADPFLARLRGAGAGRRAPAAVRAWVSMMAPYQAKAAELGIAASRVRRWITLARDGPAGLVIERPTRGLLLAEIKLQLAH